MILGGIECCRILESIKINENIKGYLRYKTILCHKAALDV